MIVRIVRMSFKPNKVEDFIATFKASKNKIRSFNGCRHLALHMDVKEDNIYYTVSHWDSSNHLEAYRASELFKSTWAVVKPLFNDQPLAYSLEEFE